VSQGRGEQPADRLYKPLLPPSNLPSATPQPRAVFSCDCSGGFPFGQRYNGTHSSFTPLPADSISRKSSCSSSPLLVQCQRHALDAAFDQHPPLSYHDFYFSTHSAATSPQGYLRRVTPTMSAQSLRVTAHTRRQPDIMTPEVSRLTVARTAHWMPRFSKGMTRSHTMRPNTPSFFTIS
jgi:hypothetical protein